MGIEFIPVGGYSEVGRNMCALKVDDEVIILDMGIDVSILAQQESEEGNIRALSTQQLIDIGLPPDQVEFFMSQPGAKS